MRGMRPLILLAAAVFLVVGFVLLRPDDDEEGQGTTATVTATAPPTIEPGPTTEETVTTTAQPEPERMRMIVTIRDGRPVGGIVRATATKNTSVLLIVRADVTDHVHVHGYDLMSDISPGHPVRMQFRARLTGRFEIELEDAKRPIAQLTVLP
jgi:hypothetical protein